MTVWSLEGGRLFPVEDQLEQKQRTGKGKACFATSPTPPKSALFPGSEPGRAEVTQVKAEGRGEMNAFWHWGEESAQGPSAPLGQLYSHRGRGRDAAAPVSPEGGVETPSRTRPMLSAQQRTCVRAVIVPLAVFRFTRSGSRLLIEIKYYEVDILGKPENEGKSPEGGVRKHRPESRHCRVPGRWLWASPLTPSTSAETEVYQCNEGPISSVSVWQCGCEDQKKQRGGISSEA